jgi:phytoene/squalene synthetase
MMMQIARARQLHASGIRVTESIPKQPAVCVRTMAGIYLGILDQIEAAPELPLRGRARISKAAKLGVMARSWLAAV